MLPARGWRGLYAHRAPQDFADGRTDIYRFGYSHKRIIEIKKLVEKTQKI